VKVKELIEYLKEFNQEKEVIIYELSDLYDTMLAGLESDDKHVYINIKNLIRGEPKGLEQ
jgi:uncharacterized protein YqgQ